MKTAHGMRRGIVAAIMSRIVIPFSLPVLLVVPGYASRSLVSSSRPVPAWEEPVFSSLRLVVRISWMPWGGVGVRYGPIWRQSPIG